MKKFNFTTLLILYAFVASAQIIEIYDTAWQNINVNGKFIFSKFDSVHGTEVWASDGTAAGTNILFDIVPGAGSSNPNYFTVIDDVVYFQTTATNDIWRTDGTPGGTYAMVSEGLTDPRDFTQVGNFILFRSGNNNSRKLWKMQSTPNSHVLLSESNMADVASLHKLNSSNILFNVKIFGSGNWEIWRTNGNTLFFVADIDSGNSNTPQMGESILFNGAVYFNGYSTANGYELWRTDGSTPGTVLVADLQSNELGSVSCANCSTPTNFTVVGNSLFFEAGNVLYGATGRQLYKTTGNGATLVKIINTSSKNANIEHAVSYDDKLYFLATDNENQKIWQSDGTESGTFQITNNAPNENLFGFGSVLNKIPIFNNHVIYNKFSTATGCEVWKLNLATGVNELVVNYNPGPAQFYTFDYFEYNNQLYFSGQLEGQNSYQMYRLDATSLPVNEVSELKKLNFFPNPTTGVVEIKTESITNLRVEVYSLNGTQMNVPFSDGKINLTSLSSGCYILKVSDGSNIQTSKIIKL